MEEWKNSINDKKYIIIIYQKVSIIHVNLRLNNELVINNLIILITKLTEVELYDE